MVLHPTLSSSNVKRSVKKFFLDGFTEAHNIHVSFSRTFSPPSDAAIKEWVNVRVADLLPGHVTETLVTVWLFSREDIEGDRLDYLKDILMELIYPGHMILYNEQWEVVGGIVIYVDTPGEHKYTEEGNNVTYTILSLQWGGQWS